MEGKRWRGVGVGGERVCAEEVRIGVVCVRRWASMRRRISGGRRRRREGDIGGGGGVRIAASWVLSWCEDLGRVS